MQAEDPDRLLFREVQKFRQPQLWVVLVFFSVFLIGFVSYVMIKQLLLGEPVGAEPLPTPILIGAGSLLILSVVGFLAMMGMACLITEVRLNGFYYGYFPFHRKMNRVALEKLKDMKIRNFKSVGELRHWDSRILDRKDIYTLSGHKGLHLELADGQCLFFGSQNPEQLARAIRLDLSPPPCQGLNEDVSSKEQV